MYSNLEYASYQLNKFTRPRVAKFSLKTAIPPTGSGDHVESGTRQNNVRRVVDFMHLQLRWNVAGYLRLATITALKTSDIDEMMTPVVAESRCRAGTWRWLKIFGARRFISLIINIIVILNCRGCRGGKSASTLMTLRTTINKRILMDY